jgi:FkbM family methyltransferase
MPDAVDQSTRRLSVGGVGFFVRTGTHDEFWDLMSSGKWEPATLAAFGRFLGPGRTLIDVGAWIGPLTLLGASLGSDVVAYEPDPAALDELRGNLSHNPALARRVRVVPVALGRRRTAATLVDAGSGLGMSTSTLLSRPDASASADVAVDDVAAHLASRAFQHCALLKVDIEGGEFDLIPRMARYLARRHPPILLSLHGDAFRARAASARHFGLVRARLASVRHRLPLVASLATSYRHWYASDQRSANADWHPLTARDKAQLALELRNRDLLLVHDRLEVAPLSRTTTPIFIISRDRLTPLRNLVDWLETAGYRRLVIVDNASTYPPLVEYLASSAHTVLRLSENIGHRAPWASGAVDEFARGQWYVVTDPDVLPIGECPPDALEHFHRLLLRYPTYEKAGFGLKIDDLPAHYAHRSEVRAWEKQFERKRLERGVYQARIDTTFALYRPSDGSYRHQSRRSIRSGHPYLARHLPWYADSAHPTPEEAYYRSRMRLDVNNWDQDDVSASTRTALDDVEPWGPMERLRWWLFVRFKLEKERT